MKLKYNNQTITLIECKSFFQRFKGFMLQKNINYALLFDHCNSVHTFFMKEAIDIIFCDKTNTILYYYPNTKPNHILLPQKNVSKVYELPTNYFNIKINDKLEIERNN